MAKRRQRIPPRIVYLACEGTETEYWYFKSLGESLDEDANVVLQIYPDQRDLEALRLSGSKGVKTDHRSLCSIAAEKLSGNYGINEAWIVIDKDRHPGLKETFEEAEQKGVRIAFSSISFEHWLLLHFEKNDKAFENSDCKTERGKYILCGGPHPKVSDLDCKGNNCVAGWIRLNDYIHDFDKSSKFIFHATQQHHSIAFVNAAWLRWRKIADIEIAKGQIFEVNPYSNVDELLKSIYETAEIILWGKLEEVLKTKDFELEVKKIETGFRIKIKNITAKSQVLLPSHFFLSNDSLEKLANEFVFDGNKQNGIIEPDAEIGINLVSEHVIEEGSYLNFKYDELKILFEP